MSASMKRIAGAVAAVVVAAATGALSRMPYDDGGGDDGLVRLSWRIRGEHVEECRPLSEEERRALPEHMRRREICEGRIAPYLLQVDVGGRVRVSDTVRAGGAREDRPVFVHRELAVRPGVHELRVRFTRLGPAGGDGPSDPGSGEAPEPPDRRASEAPGEGRWRPDVETPRALLLDRAVRVGEGDVILVTYDPEGRRLVVRGEEGGS